MTPDEVLAVLRAAVAAVLERDPTSVTRESRFRQDLGADSLALVEIVEIVEEELTPRARAGFHVEDGDLGALTTVGDAVDYALGKL